MSFARSSRNFTGVVFSFLIAASPLRTAEKDVPWPQWRGPNRDAVSRETGLLKSWPKEGPPLAWKAAKLGQGFSGVSVAKGQVYTMGTRDGKEIIIALEESGGKEAWTSDVGPSSGQDGGYHGPRCTPTFDGDLLYALGINGDLVCLEAKTGKGRWRKSLVKDFKGGVPGWGYSESPLIDGDRVLCTPGGKEATIVALSKVSGDLVLKASIPRGSDKLYGKNPNEGDGAEYSSIVIGQVGGVKQYIQLLKTGVAGISAKDGKFLWRYNHTANGTANICTPVFHESCVFTTTAYDTGGGLVKLEAKSGGIVATEVYFTRDMKNHHGGMVLVGGSFFGFDGDTLRCMDFKTGKTLWKNRSVGKGSLVFADGHLYARSEGGEGTVALVEASPKGYVEKGRFNQPDRSGANSWPHPVVAAGKLYLRDQDVLLAYDVMRKR